MRRTQLEDHAGSTTTVTPFSMVVPSVKVWPGLAKPISGGAHGVILPSPRVATMRQCPRVCDKADGAALALAMLSKGAKDPLRGSLGRDLVDEDRLAAGHSTNDGLRTVSRSFSTSRDCQSP
jgi:hypothetical protein